MNKQLSFLKKVTHPFLTSLLFMTALIIIFQSCNSGDTKKEEEKKAPEETIKTDSKGATAAFSAGPFVILKLEKQKLLDLFANNSTKKLFIQFSGDNTVSYLTAVALNVKQNGTYNNVMKTLISAAPSTWDTSGVKILGNNELSLTQIKTLIGGNVTPANAKDLYFYPKKDSNNQIFFVVSTSFIPFSMTGATQYITYPTGGQDSKPSPPAPPCDPCD